MRPFSHSQSSEIEVATMISPSVAPMTRKKTGVSPVRVGFTYCDVPSQTIVPTIAQPLAVDNGPVPARLLNLQLDGHLGALHLELRDDALVLQLDVSAPERLPAPDTQAGDGQKPCVSQVGDDGHETSHSSVVSCTSEGVHSVVSFPVPVVR